MTPNLNHTRTDENGQRRNWCIHCKAMKPDEGAVCVVRELEAERAKVTQMRADMGLLIGILRSLNHAQTDPQRKVVAEVVARMLT